MGTVVKVCQILCWLCLASTVYHLWLSRRAPLDTSEQMVHNSSFTWTLITTIACKASHDTGNVLAYKSWRQLQPPPAIIYVSTCRPYFTDGHATTTTVTTFDRTLSGLPLFGDMMALSERVTTDLVAWTNADVLLAGDVMTAIKHLLHTQKHEQKQQQQSQKLQHPGTHPAAAAAVPTSPLLWMAVAARLDLPPSATQGTGRIRIEYEIRQNTLDRFLQREGVPHTQGGGDFFVWNQPQIPIIRTPYPPYIRSACSWDNWWIHEAGQVRGADHVIDTTASMTLGHVDHSYFLPTEYQHQQHRQEGEQELARTVQFQKSASRSRWSQGVFEDWRIYHNNAVLRADKYARGFYTGLGAVMRLEMFMDSDLQLKRRKTVNEPSAYSMSLKFPIITVHNVVAEGVPSLATLLRNIPKSEHILLTGVTFGYMDMLMNWICILRQLNMDTNYLIAAFDKEAFEYLYLQGIPVFYPPGISHKKVLVDTNSAFEYGQQSFKDTTKLKIASVKIVLELGYDVLWSDSDIIFFKDFRNILQKTQHDIIMQSNNPIPKYKGYYNQRINSGFYFIRSSQKTIQLVKEVIGHSLTSLKSEQMSFDAILCANANKDFCTTANNNLIAFFDYQHFPNGGVLNYWEALMNNGTLPEDAYILHNNWIKGYSAKLNRIVKSNFWFWDGNREVCMPKKYKQSAV